MGMPEKFAAAGFALIPVAGGDLLGLFIGKNPNAFSFGLRFVLDVVKLLCHSDFPLNLLYDKTSKRLLFNQPFFDRQRTAADRVAAVR